MDWTEYLSAVTKPRLSRRCLLQKRQQLNGPTVLLALIALRLVKLRCIETDYTRGVPIGMAGPVVAMSGTTIQASRYVPAVAAVRSVLGFAQPCSPSA